MKIHIIVLSCLVTLGAALLGQRLYYQQRVADPLRAGISSVPGVSEISVETVNGRKVISLRLEEDANLWDVHAAVTRKGRQALGEAFGGVIVQDNRNAALANSFYRMHLHVQQAIATGMFTDMAEGIERIAVQDKLNDHKVFVDQHNVYIQLAQGKHRLYEVIARSQAQAQAEHPGGGMAT